MGWGGTGLRLRPAARISAFVALPLLLSGCGECENGYKVKTEYKYVTSSEFWHARLKDTLLDGAVRVNTWSLKSGRGIELRCFRHRPDAPTAKLDLRYTLYVPMLKRVVPELQKVGGTELVISVDGMPVGAIKAQPISHDDGVSFLGDIDRALLDKIGEAKKSVVVMPRRPSERLDEVIEFGVAGLSKHIEPVRSACATSLPNAQPAPATPAKKT